MMHNDDDDGVEKDNDDDDDIYEDDDDSTQAERTCNPVQWELSLTHRCHIQPSSLAS